LWCAFAPKAIAPIAVWNRDRRAHGIWERTDCHSTVTATAARRCIRTRSCETGSAGPPPWMSNRSVQADTTARGSSSRSRHRPSRTRTTKRLPSKSSSRLAGPLGHRDHTNLFGTTRHINALLAPFGIRLREDAAIPFQGVTRSFVADWYNSGPLIPQGAAFDFATSATVAAHDWRARPVIVDFGIVAEKAQYSNERNFGDLRPSLDDRAPPSWSRRQFLGERTGCPLCGLDALVELLLLRARVEGSAQPCSQA